MRVADQGCSAIVVLGCRVGTAAFDARVECAAQIYAGDPRIVVACGGRRWALGVESDAMAEALVRRGVRPTDVIRERRSMTTRENAEEARAELTRRCVDRVVLVTSRFHLERATRTFQDLGFTVDASPLLHDGLSVPARAWHFARERMSYRIQRLLA